MAGDTADGRIARLQVAGENAGGRIAGSRAADGRASDGRTADGRNADGRTPWTWPAPPQGAKDSLEAQGMKQI